MRILRPASLAVLAFAAACTASTEPEGAREVAMLDHDDAGPQVTVPATVRAGQPFTAVVVTRASGCVRGETESFVRGATADITPYYIHLPTAAERSCPAGPTSLTREVVLRFNAAGPASVRVHGRDPGGATVVVTRSVTVQ